MGATCGIFPSMRKRSATSNKRAARRNAGRSRVYQGTGHVPRREHAEASYTDTLELDLTTVKPSLPVRPARRTAPRDMKRVRARRAVSGERKPEARRAVGGRPGPPPPVAAAGSARANPPEVTFNSLRQLGGDRGDYKLHQHVEPVGDDRRGRVGEEGGGEG